MTGSPPSGSRAPRWMFDSFPVRRPYPHSAPSTTRSRVCTGLTFCHALPAPAGGVGGVERLDDDALVAGVERAVQHAGRLARRSGARTPGIRSAACSSSASSSASASRRTCSGSSSRSRPSRCSRSKKNGLSSTPASDASLPKRLIVSWNARGRPSSSRARVSPSRTAVVARQRPDPLDELGHAVGHLAQRAGPHPDVVAVAVHLDAGAVELELHGHVGAEVGERRVQRGAGAGQHRAAPAGRPPAARRRAPRPRRPAPSPPSPAAGRRA